ncbi:hypothetical protein LTR85_007285 [Meristemomyces frigidus]|nr:hypothetical protein LTR85_007285 [Meristemomyces frigidus]
MASATILPYFTGSQICGLAILNYPNYEYQGWHVTLIGYATIALVVAFNIFARKTLRLIEIIGAVMHFLFLIVFVVVLPTLGGRNSASYVFFGNSGGVSGWDNSTIEWCIGLLSAVFPLTGFDGVLHLSDEVEKPETRIPKAMIASFLCNTVVSFGFMVCLLFFMGDPNAALNSATGWPIIQICYQAAEQLAGANALMAMLIIPGIVSYFNNMASVARLTWAFARDDGLPFSDYFKVLTPGIKVHPTLRMPIRAVMLTSFVTMLLLLIPIGSATAFNDILSLAIVGLYFSYTTPPLFIFMQRLNGDEIAPSAYALGRWGVWINGAASVYGLFIIIWLCFPTELPVTATTMNWSGPIMGFIIIFALIDWMFRGRHKFAVPVEKDVIY